MNRSTVDICLILEGTYPYVSGGVASWTHNMISDMPDKSFHLVCILPPDMEKELKYDVPSNVTGISHIYLQSLSESNKKAANHSDFMHSIEGPLLAMTGKHGQYNDFAELLRLMRNQSNSLGYEALMEGEDAWELIQRMYLQAYEESSFLDYFWSWRALMGSLFSIVLADMPKAKTYHALSTGYAGLFAARAKIETGRPVILTEHGIYTNERRIEVASAEWLEETSSKALTIDELRNDLRDLWSDTFASFSRVCYEACDHIYTLYNGNRELQIKDGADDSKITVIPNGINLQHYGSIGKEPHDRLTVALIGRVVPIKDIKSFIRATSTIKNHIPDVKVMVMGPTEEEPDYYHECQQMVEYMGLQDTITFTGQVNIDRYLGQIDVLVISSISEAMPLTILEGGAAGIPTVSTDVGACKEILYGQTPEDRAIGEGGVIVPLSNPTALAEAVVGLLGDRDKRLELGNNMKRRVNKYYSREDQTAAYGAIYDHYINYTEQQAS